MQLKTSFNLPIIFFADSCNCKIYHLERKNDQNAKKHGIYLFYNKAVDVLKNKLLEISLNCIHIIIC